MYEIYLDESNGSIREEDDDIPSEDINIVNVKTDSSDKISNDANESDKKGDSDLDKSKSKSSPIKEDKETRDSKDAKDGKDSKESKDGKDSKDTRNSKESKSSSSKDKQSHSLTSSGSNNVWVSGLSSSTRAAALQTLFKKYGKVLSAKIITNPRIPGSRAHGFITMETAEQAEKCIQNLNKTDLDGKTIFVSKNRPSESSSSSRHKSSTSSSSNKKEKPKDKDSKSKSDENKDPDKEKSKDDSKKSEDKSAHEDDKKKKEKLGDKDKEKEKDRPKDRDKEKDKTKSRDKDKDKDKSKDKEKEKKKDDDKDQSKEKSDRDKGGEKEKTKEKDRKDDKSKDDKDDDKKDESKDDNKNKKDRSSKSTSRSRSRDRKRGSQSPPRKLLRRPMGRRMGPGFLGRRMNTRGRSASSRPNPVLLRRIETERAQRRRERDREIMESKRRRIELIRTQREVERKAQEERDRLEREMVKLRIERERLEREKAELLRLEREKARLERERIEREREELRRKQFQLPHRIDDSPRGRSGINKRPYDSRADPREIDIHWDDRKRMSAPSPVTPSGRTSFNGAVASRMSDFDARHGHNSAPYDNKGASYRRIKLDNPSSGGGGLRNEYDSRRDSGRHGNSGGGHDRDDRRSTGGSGSGYYRDSARMTGASRDRDRRGGGGGGRDDWKSSHDNRRDRYLDKGLSSIGTSYSTGASYSGGSSGDWAGERGSSNMSKLSYPAGPSVSESRSRGAGMGSSMMTGGANQMADLYDNSSSIPMSGIMSHGGIGSNSGLTSDERPYLHSVRRF